MAELTDASAPLDARETARLTDFARACKAAARAVLLYPTGASRDRRHARPDRQHHRRRRR